MNAAGKSSDYINVVEPHANSSSFGVDLPRCKGKIIRLYEIGGTAGIKPGKRGHRAGENRSLTEEQERLLQHLICEKRPEQMKMDFVLWNRAAVSQLIKQECHISMPIRTVGH
ncbi:MAG: hypothetical protein Q7S71_01465, partial [Candidatus Nitrotoga sp.]|nr:hypothetical protein [Candidatus Nitrotoga sp.]